MATITTSDPYFYKNGDGGVSPVIGYESRSNRVARYKFTAPPDGASHIALSFGYASIGDSQCHKEAPMRFAITKAESHNNANGNAGYSYDGTLTIKLQSGAYMVSGSADVMLMPGDDYYLYLFPGSTTYCWWHWSTRPATITASGAAGVVHIDTGSRIVRAIPYIDTGNGWVQAIPYIDNGSSFKPAG